MVLVFAMHGLLVTYGLAVVTLPPVFSDHMVLQDGNNTPIWGTADPGETVIVSVGNRSATAETNSAGRWCTELNLAGAGPGPFQLIVEGKNRIAFEDVLVGEVWVASGQSNMAMRLVHASDGIADARKANHSQLRIFSYSAGRPSLKPETNANGRWKLCESETAGRFSAVAYYYGRDLHEVLQTPVGIVDISMGGTAAESWMSQQAIERDPVIHQLQRRMIESIETYPARIAAYSAELDAWLREHGRADRALLDPVALGSPTLNDDTWMKVHLPGNFAEQGLPDSGAVWLRKRVPVSPGMAGRRLVVKMGLIRDFTTVYWDGVEVGATGPETMPVEGERWTYHVPGHLVREGQAVLAVRVFSPSGDARFISDASGSSFRVTADPLNEFYLAGEWLAYTEYSLRPPNDATGPGPTAPSIPPELKSVPGVLYNGHVHPVLPYGLRGIIWYQGESNTARAWRYRTLFPEMIEDWRTSWGRKDLPFYFCQLPNFGPKATKPDVSTWAELREAQALTAVATPQTAIAVLIDLGEESDIHPRNKRDVGARLARVALANAYGRDVPWSAAQYRKMELEQDKVRIHFDHTYGALQARALPSTYRPRSSQPETVDLVRNNPESEIEGFAVCGPDRAWVWAMARIEGETVVVWSPEVAFPTAVRYAWADNPNCHLYNGAGLPVAPFRTDNFPISTQASRDHAK